MPKMMPETIGQSKQLPKRLSQQSAEVQTIIALRALRHAIGDARTAVTALENQLPSYGSKARTDAEAEAEQWMVVNRPYLAQ